MDKYLTVRKSSKVRPQNGKGTDKDTCRYTPYPDVRSLSKSDVATATSSLQKRYLLETLKEESNPITHSNIVERTDFISSISSGHQVAETRGVRREYLDDRSEKLSRQRVLKFKNNDSSLILSNTRIYINGYLEDTTDIEMKRIISLNGGQVLNTASNATHILTSQTLSGTKTHRILTKRLRTPVQVVRPEWVWDSLEAGKRLSEFPYLVLQSVTGKLQ